MNPGLTAPAFRIARWRQAVFSMAACLGVAASSVDAQEMVPVEDPSLPKTVEPTHFEAFLGNSPFLRTLSLSETFALRGIAEIDGEKVATLYNRKTEKSILVSAKPASQDQMKLLAVNEMAGWTLGEITATIAVAGEEVELKFEPARVAPGPKGGGPGGKGGDQKKGGDEKRGPSQQDIERYKSLTDAQREKFREYMRQTMQKYPDLSREERGNMIRGALTRLTDGRDITTDSSNGGSNGSNNGGGGGGGDRR